jgi:hypothetical protein
MRTSRDKLIARPVALARPISPENDGYGFARGIDLRFDGDRLVVLENQNSRLVVFDTSWKPIGKIGKEGPGPGELRGAVRLDVHRGEYAVGEINNARISLFRRDGRFVRAFGVPEGFAEFAYGPDGRLYVNAIDSRHYLLAIDAAGLRRPFGSRAWELYPSQELNRPSPRPGSVLVATGRDGSVHVYDQVLGAMVRFDPSGQRTAVVKLSEQILFGLRQADALVRQDFGGSAADAVPAATDLTATDDGRLLLLFPPVERTFGLLINPDTYEGTVLEWAEELGRQAGRTGVIHLGRFYQLRNDEVAAFVLEPSGP